MKKGSIIAITLVMVAVIIIIIAVEFHTGRPGKRGENLYAFKIGTLAEVDSSWLGWEEIRNIVVQKDSLAAIASLGEDIYLSGAGFFMKISPEGRQEMYVSTEGTPTALTVTDSAVYLAFTHYITRFSPEGEIIREWEPLNGLSYITSLKVTGDLLFAADAGNRTILNYKTDGTLLKRISGNTDNESVHGFIIPSPYFDLDIHDNELWVANPGMHTLEYFGLDGTFRGFWSNPSYDLKGFSGCCNPAHIAVMDDGTIVTSEKGLVRIKIYKPSGELLSVVAQPALFGNTNVAPDLAVSPSGLIYALDFSQNKIRVFRKIAE